MDRNVEMFMTIEKSLVQVGGGEWVVKRVQIMQSEQSINEYIDFFATVQLLGETHHLPEL